MLAILKLEFMESYVPNQRYTSKGEPELGVGILTELSKGKILLHFPLSDETRLYAVESASLQRVVFKPGDTIVDAKGHEMRIEKVELLDNLYSYQGEDRKISEAELGDVSSNQGVDDRLFMGDVDTPSAFALRRETLEHEHKRCLSAVNGFVGGRIDLIPHQLYIAHEVSSRYAPRVLLSDQVGLGKTIEACLILHRLLLSGRISRVLILVPETLLHQWFVEVLRRFNMWFNIFDEERCVALDESAPEGNPFLDNQLIMCSIEFLAASKKRTSQALAAGWDMLVVDEAHKLQWSLDKVSKEYATVELLSKVAKALLLLTATPEQLGIESHFARLRLLDPSRYADYHDFIHESSDNKGIADIVEKLYLGSDLNAQDIEALSALLSKEELQSFKGGEELAKDQLIENLLDQHGPGRVLFRNTRSAMKGFPKRIAELVPLTAGDEQAFFLEKLKKEFAYDLGLKAKKGKPKFSFDCDPRLDWLLAKLKQLHPAKALLICKSKEKVLALKRALTAQANLKVAVFHEDLSIVKRDRNAAWFSEGDGAQILLCSEIGSEGRNFQFAHHLILFDLPLHPELLEQRIGRLDRIGQAADIHIHIPYLVNSPQHMLVKWFHEGLNAFEKNLEGGNRVSELFSQDLLDLAESPANVDKNTDLQALISDTTAFNRELQNSLADGHDRLLEMNSFRPTVAAKLVQQIQDQDKDRELENYLTRVFNHFDIEMEDLASRTYYLKPASIISETFPSIPLDGISVTFDRKHALSREDISFLTWDHPMVTDSIDLILSSGTGTASYGILRGGKSPGLLLELLFVLETPTGSNTSIDRFLPKTPIRVVVDHSAKPVTDQYPVEAIEHKLIPGQIDALLDNETLVDTLLPKMISVATTAAKKISVEEVNKGLHHMNSTLKHEIERLKTLQEKNNNIRPEEIQIAIEEQKALASLINNARVRLDAIQLIRV